MSSGQRGTFTNERIRRREVGGRFNEVWFGLVKRYVYLEINYICITVALGHEMFLSFPFMDQSFIHFVVNLLPLTRKSVYIRKYSIILFFSLETFKE